MLIKNPAAPWIVATLPCETLMSAKQAIKHCDFLKIDISQGSVAARLGCGGVLKDDCVTNVLPSRTVKEFWKSVNFWRSYGQEYSVLFLTDRVHMHPFHIVFISVLLCKTKTNVGLCYHHWLTLFCSIFYFCLSARVCVSYRGRAFIT